MPYLAAQSAHTQRCVYAVIRSSFPFIKTEKESLQTELVVDIVTPVELEKDGVVPPCTQYVDEVPAVIPDIEVGIPLHHVKFKLFVVFDVKEKL